MRQTSRVRSIIQGLSSPARTGIAAGATLFITVVAMIAAGAVGPADLITPGERGPSARVIADDFGDAALPAGKTGYDGQQTYAIARYFPDLDAAAEQTDSGRYRMLRILPAVIASPAPAGAATVLALLAVNVVGFGIAVTAMGRIGHPYGLGPRVALAASAPLLLGVFGTTTGPIAWGLALTALERTIRDRHLEAVGLLTAAALCRESVAATGAFIAAALLWQRRRAALALVPLYAIPGVVVLAWFGFLTAVVGGRFAGRTHPLAFLELRGALIVVPALVFVLGVLGAWAWRDVPVLALPCLGYTAWMFLYTTNILDDVAILRVNALAIVLGIAGAARLLSRQDDAVRIASG